MALNNSLPLLLAMVAASDHSLGQPPSFGTTVVHGASNGDNFGWSVAAGDANGDGVPDLLAGAPSALNAANQQFAGKCYLFYGPITGPTAAQQADAVFVAANFGDNLGIAVAFIDANNNGIKDVMLGARGHDGAGTQAGRVYVFNGPVNGTFNAELATAVISGSPFDEIGRALAVGDLNHDGIQDAILGAPAASAGNGVVYVLFGPLSGHRSVTSANAVVTAALPSESLGTSVAAADLNGDQIDDLIIGGVKAPFEPLAPGRTYVFFGPLSGSMPASSAQVIIEGELVNDFFGQSVATGDFNGDQAADLLVGANQFFRPGPGKAYVFHGPLQPGFRGATSADAIIAGEADRDQLGTSVAGVGDMNLDGRDELVVAATRSQSAASNRTYVFFGPLAGPVPAAQANATLDGQTSDNRAHAAVAAGGDIDGSGLPDVLIGSPGHPSAPTAGTVTIFGPSGAPPCYPNCDASTTAPILNVADFSCFLQKYAAGVPYANCDESTVQPVLNVADFSCFLQKYAAGCP